MLEMQYNVLYLLPSTHVQSTSKNVSGKDFTVIKYYYIIIIITACMEYPCMLFLLRRWTLDIADIISKGGESNVT